MKNIHILPTNKPSKLHNTFNVQIGEEINSIVESRHIYITSDEEIKFNDYIIDGYKVWQWKDDSSLLGRKKVILTTDQDLIKDGVQDIDDEFLKWFVNNPSCEGVKIESWEIKGKCQLEYEIIIPKKETKQETLEEVAEKLYPKSENQVIDFANELKREGFLKCAKWQQEQDKDKYSKDVVDELLDKLLQNNMCSVAGDELVEKFKNETV